jgi:Rieske Fe-S protein
LLERRGILPIADSKDYRLTVAGTPLAAAKYMAAEYLQGQAANIRSDIYSLGVILFELLRGSLLSQEANPLAALAQQGDTIPRSLQEVLRCAFAEDPDERFRRVSDLLVAFAAEVEQEKSTYAQRRSNAVAVEETAAKRGETISWQRTPSEQLPSVAQPAPLRPAQKTGGLATRVANNIGRRKVTAMFAAGVVAGVVGVGAIVSLKDLLNAPAPAAPASTQTGTVISNTKQSPNSAAEFNDPHVPEHRQSALVRLPNGTFVAYKRGCTHVGVLVNYDSKTQMLVCPAHGAIFDPAQGGRVVKEPESTPSVSIQPLPKVTFHVNSDGTITV